MWPLLDKKYELLDLRSFMSTGMQEGPTDQLLEVYSEHEPLDEEWIIDQIPFSCVKCWEKPEDHQVQSSLCLNFSTVR